MPDPYVRQVAELRDMDELRLVVGTDYDAVTIGSPGRTMFRLTRSQAEEFAQAFVAACWEASDNARLMAEDT